MFKCLTNSRQLTLDHRRARYMRALKSKVSVIDGDSAQIFLTEAGENCTSVFKESLFRKNGDEDHLQYPKEKIPDKIDLPNRGKYK